VYNKHLKNQKKMKRLIMLSTLAAALLAGCSNNETASTTGAKELGMTVKVGSSSATRSLTDAFSANDKIGVFITGTGYTSKLAAYTLNAGVWNSPALEADKVYLTSQAATVYSFFPSTAMCDMAGKTITTTTNASDDFAATAATDFMYGLGYNSTTYSLAQASSLSAAAAKPDLYFFHALTKVSFVVNKASTYPASTDAGKLTQVQLTKSTGKFALQGTTSLTDGTFTPTTTAAQLTSTLTLTAPSSVNINAYSATASTTVSAFGLFAPCADLSDVTLSLTIDGKVLSTVLPTAAWAKGKNYIYTITVSGTELQIGTVQIISWDSSNETGMQVN
jgi:hypothetical protein